MQKPATEIDWSHQLNETHDTSNPSAQDYTEMAKVYKNPLTGKLIIVGG